jgi:hypothetical protein
MGPQSAVGSDGTAVAAGKADPQVLPEKASPLIYSPATKSNGVGTSRCNLSRPNILPHRGNNLHLIAHPAFSI